MSLKKKIIKNLFLVLENRPLCSKMCFLSLSSLSVQLSFSILSSCRTAVSRSQVVKGEEEEEGGREGGRKGGKEGGKGHN